MRASPFTCWNCLFVAARPSKFVNKLAEEVDAAFEVCVYGNSHFTGIIWNLDLNSFILWRFSPTLETKKGRGIVGIGRYIRSLEKNLLLLEESLTQNQLGVNYGMHQLIMVDRRGLVVHCLLPLAYCHCFSLCH